MLDNLLNRRTEAERRFEEADAQLAQAILDGNDALVVKLRRIRREAAEEADDMGDALRLAEDRQEQQALSERIERLKEARSAASDKAKAFVEAGIEVDRAIAALEIAVGRQQETAKALSQALRFAGLSDGDRIGRSLPAAMRWALWNGAPAASQLAGLPWTPAMRRKSMRDGAKRLVPAIPKEG